MTAYLREELTKAINTTGRKPLIICGAGVSSQATNGNAPSWSGLVLAGINLDPVCELAVETGVAKNQIPRALAGLADFHRFSGRATIQSLMSAASKYRTEPPSHAAATCFLDLGMIATQYWNPMASEYLKTAQKIYHAIGNKVGEANALHALADSLDPKDADAARVLLEEAKNLYRGRDPLGDANCKLALSELDGHINKMESAEALANEALAIYHQLGNTHSEANCFVRLALHRAFNATSLADSNGEKELVRQLWSNIKRRDLIKEWLDWGPS